MSSDLVGSGIPFLDYRTYAERIFFPGHQESPLRRDLDVPESRRQTVEQGLIQLSNLLNSKLFLTKVSLHSCFLLNLCLFIYAAYICKASPNPQNCWFYFAATTLQCQPYVHAIEGWGGPILEIQSYSAKVYLVSTEARGIFHTQIN